MATLRHLLDHKAIDIHANNDVFNHLSDVKQKQADADTAIVKLHHKLAPARQLIDLVDKVHPLPGMEDQEQQFDENGQPIPMQNQQPGQQVNPMSRNQVTNQQMKQTGKVAKPTSNKSPLPKEKNAKSKSTGSEKKGNKGFEVNIKGEEDSSGYVKKIRTKKRFDYHDDAGLSHGGGRAIGLSSSKSKKK